MRGGHRGGGATSLQGGVRGPGGGQCLEQLGQLRGVHRGGGGGGGGRNSPNFGQGGVHLGEGAGVGVGEESVVGAVVRSRSRSAPAVGGGPWCHE